MIYYIVFEQAARQAGRCSHGPLAACEQRGGAVTPFPKLAESGALIIYIYIYIYIEREREIITNHARA